MPRESEEKNSNKLKSLLKDVIAIFIWMSLVLKITVFDWDIYLITNYAPSLQWLLSYKIFLFLGLISISWLVIGKNNFPLFCLYVIGYPFVLFFWKMPKLLFRNWSAAFIIAPVIFEVFTAFRFYFISCSFASIAAACILAPQSTVGILLTSMVTLFIFLVMCLWLNLRQAYKSTVFSKISQSISAFKEKLEDTSYLMNILNKYQTESKESNQSPLSRQLSNFYIINCFIDVLNEKIRHVMKNRIMDLYCIISWGSTFAITCIIFSFEYMALFKISPNSFFVPFEPNYFSFLGFSFGKMTPTSVSKIVPEELYAEAICYAQIFSSIVILMILFFTFLTTSRERYKEDIKAITDELTEIGIILQQGSIEIFNLAFSEVETTLMNHEHQLVNGIRTLRGKPRLEPPIDSSNEQLDSEIN